VALLSSVTTAFVSALSVHSSTPRLTAGLFVRVFHFIHTLNFKSIAASALIALSTFGGVAEAAPTKCAMRHAGELLTFTCDHTLRTNANGHKINDITFFEGGKRYDWSILFWTNRSGNPTYAEVWYNGQRHVMDAYIAKNKAWCVSNNGTQFCVH